MNLTGIGQVTIDSVYFIGAMNHALLIDTTSGSGPASSVANSYFGAGLTRSYLNGSLNVPADESGAHYTAIWLKGPQTGAWSNEIYYSGTAAVHAGFWSGSSNQYIVDNVISMNRYEVTDFDPGTGVATGGGQVYVSATGGATSVVGNVINGNYYTRQQTAPATGCGAGVGQSFDNPHPAGIEGEGESYYTTTISSSTWVMACC